MDPYVRRTFYYETDQMGIVHHSNYIRWMEEARMNFMSQVGLVYDEMEKAGLIMPVTFVDCKYKESFHFNETISIIVSLTQFTGVRVAFHYEIKNEGGSVMATGNSGHCFLDAVTRRPVNLKRKMPAFSELFKHLLAQYEVL